MTIKNNLVRIACVGKSGVGKTTIVKAIVDQKIPPVLNDKPTIGVEFFLLLKKKTRSKFGFIFGIVQEHHHSMGL